MNTKTVESSTEMNRSVLSGISRDLETQGIILEIDDIKSIILKLESRGYMRKANQLRFPEPSKLQSAEGWRTNRTYLFGICNDLGIEGIVLELTDVEAVILCLKDRGFMLD